MSTRNFHNENGRNVFAMDINEDYEYEDAIENICYGLDAEFNNDYRVEDEYDKDALRSYGGKIIASVYGESKYYKKLDIEVQPRLEIVVRNGYYSGINFDYRMIYDITDDEIEDSEELFDMLVDNAIYYKDLSKKEAIRNAKFAEKYLEKSMEELRDKVEKVLSEYTTPLNCVGTFSNGEAVYKKAM